MREFSSEGKCREYLANLRWPGGIICPKCNCRHTCLLSNRRYQCAECRCQTSVTAGAAFVKKVVVETADAEIAAAGVKLEYEVGTMIEIPRAALTAEEIAKEADFFCFGTNDLTQMTFGFSRDDAGKFLNAYYDTKIFENDPFAKLDQTGVGKLMELSLKLGKPVNPKLHVGICGEHGGDPSSVEFCHKIGLDYVSCSPFRVPIARLAAAQAAINN